MFLLRSRDILSEVQRVSALKQRYVVGGTKYICACAEKHCRTSKILLRLRREALLTITMEDDNWKSIILIIVPYYIFIPSCPPVCFAGVAERFIMLGLPSS